MSTVFYDDQCLFCTRFVSWIQKKEPSFRLYSLRDKEARQQLRERGEKFVSLQTIYIITDKQEVKKKSQAIFTIFRKLRYPWKMVSWLRCLPVQLTDWGYTLFAKHRYKILKPPKPAEVISE